MDWWWDNTDCHATIHQLSHMLAARDLRNEQLQAELAAQQQQQALLMERVATLEAREPRIAKQEAKLLRPQEPPPVSSARVDAHLATTKAAVGDALNAAETAAETAGDGTPGGGHGRGPPPSCRP